MPSYPSSIKTFTSLTDGIDNVLASHQNEPNDEITQIETELGVAPKTITDATAPAASPASVAQYLDMVATALKTIMGSANWYTTAAAIMKAIGTAKGDIIAFSGSGVPIRRAVGTNLQVLVSDSGETDGVKWSSFFSNLPDGFMINGKISVTVVSNDLVLALKNAAGNDPSASDPVHIKINGTVRVVTAATSCTLADATNWFDAGGTMFATKEIDYFAYAVWDSNSSVVAVAPARIPFGCVVSDFSATTTNQKHLGNYANFTTTDDVCVIGRFAATLSAGAGYTWTVPTFTNANLIQRPIFETRWLSYLPTYAAGGSMTFGTVTTSLAIYQVRHQLQEVKTDFNGTTGGSASNIITFTLPFSVGGLGSGLAYGTAYVLDAAPSAGYWRVYPGGFGTTGVEVLKGDESAFGLGASRYTRGSIVLPI